MGVFGSIKNMPRKVKKTIRRSLSGVCMFSALLVAIVPPQTTVGYVAPGNSETKTDYTYGVQATDVTSSNILSQSVELDLYDLGNVKYAPYPNAIYDKDDTDHVYKVLKVKKLSDGSYIVNWQFRLYLQDVNGTDMGVICEYNSTYEEPTVEVKPTMPIEYCMVDNDFYDDFFSAFTTARTNGDAYPTFERLDGTSETPTTGVALATKWTISSVAPNTDTSYDQYWISKYFPDQFNTWVANKNAYSVYTEAVEAWEAADPETRGARPAEVPNPADLTCYINDMTDANKLKYFCAVHPDYKDKLTAEEYTLVPVANSVEGGSGTAVTYCYMPKGTPNINDNDEFGFHYTKKTYVIAIGSKAFAGIGNVDQLDLCEEIKYIGDEAFLKSYVKGVTFENVENIGNRAFKECSELSKIDLKDGAVNIGTEAFYGCALTNVIFPYSIEYIGPGAFAGCTKLTNVDLSAISRENVEIDDFAFYDDIRLEKVTFSDKIIRLGEACFATNQGVTGSLTTFNFPDHIYGMVTRKDNKGGQVSSQANGIGNFLLAGRTNLQYVTMPSDYGKGSQVTLPYGVFYNCTGLKSVTFPDVGGSCGYCVFGKEPYGTDPYTGETLYRTLFDTVLTEDFYVKGPEKNMAGQISGPRQSTWGLKSGLGNDIPYVYNDTHGVEQFEISDGNYILIVDHDGLLQSCKFASDELPDAIDLVIPETVGKTKVTGIATECFSDPLIRNRIRSLKISDNSLTEIAPEAFKGCPALEEVSIGNSVTKIGRSAFENCPLLTYVNFETPKDGYASFPISNIGDNAFSTGANSLIFEGDIDESYGPFVWATDVNNYVNQNDGIRVCYYTGAPTYLTVIVDNRNGLPTLLDYPHYEQLDQHAIELNTDPEAFAEGHPLTERYEKLGQEDIDETTNTVLYSYDISLREEELVNGVLHINIPSGIKSIDAKGFITNTSKEDSALPGVHTNNKNVFTYIANSSSKVYSPYYQTYREYGLFGGEFGGYTDIVTGEKREYDSTDEEYDKPLAAKYEVQPQGNDRVESITLSSIKYLPENAFYSCERLGAITLGNSLETMEAAPFAGCTNLSSIGSNTAGYICYNGIVYSTNPDGTYNIVEVLSSRGNLVGSQKIKVGEDDPYLSNVSTISPGAVENCSYISGIDLRGMSLLKELPDEIFKDCSKLNQVIIPDNITIIGHNAFAGCMEGIEIVCYGKEVFLPSDAFGTQATNDDNTYVNSKRLISYSDSAVRKSARDLGADVSEVLDDTVKVQFFDYNGAELSPIVYVTKGTSIALENIPKDPVRTGYTFAGWNKALTNITEDAVIVATYTQNPVENPEGQGQNQGQQQQQQQQQQQNTSPTFYTLTVTNGNGSGSYAAGATVIITCTNPPSGKVFNKWVPTTDDLNIASVNVAATTLVMPAHEASVTATFSNKPSDTGGTTSKKDNNTSTTTSSGNNNNNGSSVIISKPGISNTGLASATVNGSNDNYIVRIAETAAAVAAVEKALTNEYGSLDNIRYSAMDITLYDSTGTTKITDYSGLSVTITIPIPSVMTQYAGNNKASGVVNEKLDKLNAKFTSIDGVPCITFTATHFSPYVIYVNTANLSEGNKGQVIDETPKTGDIQPKWFLVGGLVALSIALFFMKDKRTV